MDILIEESQGSLWAAGLISGRLEGLEIDPAYEEVRWGSIYYAKVKTIDTGLDAIFLDLDGDNTGILYNGDTRHKGEDGNFTKGGAKSISKSFKPGDMVMVQAKTAYLPQIDDEHTKAENKIPQMSMDITLPGRYVIFCAAMHSNKVSSRIRDKKLRKQIRTMASDLDDIQGCILRASAANTQTDILRREAKILRAAWEEISALGTGQDPSLIMLGPDAIQRTLSDHADKHIETIEVVTMDHYNYVEEWCSVFAPDLMTKITPIELDSATEDLALLYYRDIMGQIEDLFSAYAFLPSGGNIIIQSTAALTSIDINKGSDKGAHLAVNLESITESIRQIRLRNIGGIIMLDLLKVKNKKDEGIIIAALEAEAAKDPCTIQIHGLTGAGLMEITRKRRTPDLGERLSGMSFE